MPASAEAIEKYYQKKKAYLEALKTSTGELRPLDLDHPDRDYLKMPVLPKEDETHGNLTDQVAKESAETSASTHKLHQEAHKANLGPVKADSLPEAASKEELKKRAEELNK